MAGRDWRAWHDDYDVPGSDLARRLAAVQDRIREALDSAPPGPLRAVSMCAGQSRDLIGVLASHPRGREVTARLVELDPHNAAIARAAAADAGLPAVEVVTADAALTDAYAGLIPADIVLACGGFGNITDGEVKRTVGCWDQLCAASGTVVWTRGRWQPDLIPQICRWFAEQEFELLWLSDPGAGFGVGAHRFSGGPRPRLPRPPPPPALVQLGGPWRAAPPRRRTAASGSPLSSAHPSRAACLPVDYGSQAALPLWLGGGEVEIMQADEWRAAARAGCELQVHVVRARGPGDVGRDRPPGGPAAGVPHGEAPDWGIRGAVKHHLHQATHPSGGPGGDPRVELARPGPEVDAVVFQVVAVDELRGLVAIHTGWAGVAGGGGH